MDTPALDPIITREVLNQREIDDLFWYEVKVKHQQLLAILGTPDASPGIPETTVTDQERQQRLRQLRWDLDTYFLRLSHLATSTFALGDEVLPNLPSDPAFPEVFQRLVERMKASGELVARETAFREYNNEETYIDHEMSGRRAMVIYFPNISEGGKELYEAIIAEHRDLYVEVLRRSMENYYRRLAEIGNQFRPWYEEQDRLQPMQRPQNWLDIPASLPFHTFPEAAEVHRAIADGPTLHHWEETDGEVAMRHAVPGAPLQTKFVPSLRFLEFHKQRRTLTPGSQESGPSLVTVAPLFSSLGMLTFDANLLFAVCLSLVIETGSFSASLDQLGRLIGWMPKTAEERDSFRLMLWRWLLMLDSYRVVGARKGTWRDPRDRKIIRDVSSDDDLLHISGTLDDVQRRVDGVPFEVTLTAGPWVEKMRGDKSFFSYLGDVKRLATKPRGRLPARLAVTIGVCLLQRWREMATHRETQVHRTGNQNRTSVRFEGLTPRGILTAFGQGPASEFEARLLGSGSSGSDRPGDAVKYWNQAIKYLKEWKIVGYYTEIPPRLVEGYGWQKNWYKKQGLDIRPAPSISSDVAEIHAANRSVEKARAARRQKFAEKNGTPNSRDATPNSRDATPNSQKLL